MSARDIIFVIVAIGAFLALAFALLRALTRERNSAKDSWDDLLGRILAVDRMSLKEVAFDLVDRDGAPRQDESRADLSSDQVWSLLGGIQGLEKIERNCSVLIDIAAYLQRWHPESVVVAHNLRLSAREIEWHVERLRAASKAGKLEPNFLMYGQQAAVVYYRMTQELLNLYSHANPTMYAQLAKAL
jgi:hypothetical protein